jgi:hypothetical protein
MWKLRVRPITAPCRVDFSGIYRFGRRVATQEGS